MRRRLQVTLGVLSLPVMLFLGVALGMPMFATCGGHDEAVTTLIEKCPRAMALLGADPHPARMGTACGGTVTEDGSGSAHWTLAWVGDRARGTVTFEADERADEWRVRAAVLTVGEQQIDLVACPIPP